ncbi:MAG: radical SAM protein, partial [Desulfobacteraceae bacterium]|nr:radical SAM protein [Desulfobacteraceae bacterium]
MQVQASPVKRESEKRWRFSDITADPAIGARWEKVRKYFFLRESTYDMTNRCNIRCEGCYYYEGDKQFAKEKGDPEAWRKLMMDEKARGITYVVLAGAEPSLVPELCQVCFEEMPLGSIASNGLRHIPQPINYKIHLSVWGDDETSLRVRKARDMLLKQIDNYRDDPRAVFVYTFTRENIDEIHRVMEILARHECKVTFNVFSSPVGYDGPLRHTRQSLAHTRKTMMALLSEYPENLLFSFYN